MVTISQVQLYDSKSSKQQHNIVPVFELPILSVTAEENGPYVNMVKTERHETLFLKFPKSSCKE